MTGERMSQGRIALTMEIYSRLPGKATRDALKRRGADVPARPCSLRYPVAV